MSPEDKKINNKLVADKEILIQALNDINILIFGNNIIIASGEYFKIRRLCVNAIKEVGGIVK